MPMTDTYLDLANAQLNEDLRSNLAATFYVRTAFTDMLRKGGQIKPWPGTPLVTDTLITGVPGSVQPVVTGDETWTPTLTQITKKVSIEQAELVGYLPMPIRLIRENKNSKLQLVNLMQSYPDALMLGLTKTMNQWLLTATIPSSSTDGAVVSSTADMARIATLNGLWASGLGTGVTNGILDFAAPASQTDTVFNLAKSSTYGHINQYAAITAMATDGELKLRQLVRKTRNADPAGVSSSSSKSGGANLLIMDPDSYDKFYAGRDEKVLISTADADIGNSYMEKVTIDNAKITYDQCMDRTASIFSGTDAANGFGYALNMDYWILFEHEAMNIGAFEKVQMREFLVARIGWCGQLFCKRLNTQGAFTGGAI